MNLHQELYEPAQAHQVMENAWRLVKASLMAGHRLELIVRDPARTPEQSSRMHAMIGDIAKKVQIHGNLLDRDSMKRILVSAFKHDTKDDPELGPLWARVSEINIMPGLRGEFVVLGDQTRRFPRKLAASFIEWLFAFGAEHSVRWSDPAIPKDSE